MTGMVRAPDRWASMVPEVVAAGSPAQMIYAIRDAQHDIATLLAQRDAALKDLHAGDRHLSWWWANLSVANWRMARRIVKHRRIITRLLSLRRRDRVQRDAADRAGRERGVREAAAIASKVALSAHARQKAAKYPLDNARHEGRKLGASAISRAALRLLAPAAIEERAER
jgi:hypothetical protein